MIRLFVGFDHRIIEPFHVLSHSVWRSASTPVAITPIMINQVKRFHDRPKNQLASTEFSFSRFLVPFLCQYDGWAIFTDNDMMFREDIYNLWQLRDDKYAVMCVKHEHTPQSDHKFLNEKQTRYEKKNWSSVMLFNCKKCKALTPAFVNEASGLELHQFKWLESDDLIGELPHKWNHLVGYDAYNPAAANVHWTEGGPYFQAHQEVDYAEEWFEMREHMHEMIDRDTPIVMQSSQSQVSKAN
jgi:hypothetical protein